MKYDIPALGRRLVPLYLAWIATAVFLGIMAGAANMTGFLAVISALLYGVVTTAVIVMTIILVIQRYSTSLLGDGGYFTNVLPVKAGTLIMSKTLSATLWVFLSGIVAAVTGLIIGLLDNAGTVMDTFHAIGYFLGELGGQDVLIMIELLVLVIVSCAKSILAVYTAITIGHQSGKHVVLSSIGAYIGVLIFESLVGQIAFKIVGIQNISFNSIDQFADIQVFFVGTLLLTLAIASVYYFVDRYLMTKRLNLQ
jgi:hypothetical protein